MASVWETMRREAEAAGETKAASCGKYKHWAMDPRRVETIPGDDPARLLQGLHIGPRPDKDYDATADHATLDRETYDRALLALSLLPGLLEKNAAYRVPTNAKREERLFKAKLKGLLEHLAPIAVDGVRGEDWPVALDFLNTHSCRSGGLLGLVRHHDPGWQLVSQPSFRCFVELQLIQRFLRPSSQPLSGLRNQNALRKVAQNLIHCVEWASSCVLYHGEREWGLVSEKAASHQQPGIVSHGSDATFDGSLSVLRRRRPDASAREDARGTKLTAQGLSKAQLKRRAKKATLAPPPEAQVQEGPVSVDTPEDQPRIEEHEEESEESSQDTSSQSEESEEEAGESGPVDEESPDAEVEEAGDGRGWLAVGKRGSVLKGPDAAPSHSTPPPAKTDPGKASEQSGETEAESAEGGKAESREEWLASWAAVRAAGPWTVPTSPYTALRHHLSRIAQQALDNPYPRPHA